MDALRYNGEQTLSRFIFSTPKLIQKDELRVVKSFNYEMVANSKDSDPAQSNSIN